MPNEWKEMIFLVQTNGTGMADWLSSLERDPLVDFVGEVIVTRIDNERLHVLVGLVMARRLPQAAAPTEPNP